MFEDNNEDQPRKKTIRDILEGLDPTERQLRREEMIKSPLYQEGYNRGRFDAEKEIETYYKDVIRTLSVIIAENHMEG